LAALLHHCNPTTSMVLVEQISSKVKAYIACFDEPESQQACNAAVKIHKATCGRCGGGLWWV